MCQLGIQPCLRGGLDAINTSQRVVPGAGLVFLWKPFDGQARCGWMVRGLSLQQGQAQPSDG